MAEGASCQAGTAGRFERDFERALACFEQSGCAALVVGAVSTSAFRAVSRRWMGDVDLERYRILASLTDHDGCLEEYFPGSLGPADPSVRSVAYPSDRSTAGTAGTRERSPGARLRADLWDALEAAEPPSGFGPGQLRVVVNSLGPLLYGGSDRSASGSRTAAAVEELACRLTGPPYNAKVQFHFAAASDHPAVAELSSAVDLRIELRERQGVPEHRWVIPAGELDRLDREDTLRSSWLTI